MTWKKPEFTEVSLCMEVTAYVNTEDELPLPADGALRGAAGRLAGPPPGNRTRPFEAHEQRPE